MRCTLPIFVALLFAPLAVAQAQQTVTTRDIVELSKARLPEEVLLALIEVNRPIFPVDTDTLKGLRESGVAPNVIIAMIKSGRELPPPAPIMTDENPTQAPPPQVVDVDHGHEEEFAPRVRYEERVREVAVPYPVYIPVRARPGVRPQPKSAEPVYWGFGGKLRPDAWKPTAVDVQKDARVPSEPQRK